MFVVRTSHQPSSCAGAPEQPGRSRDRERRERGTPLQVESARCCGLDVHQKSVVACVLLSAEDGTVQRQVRTFGTMTADLLALNDWLNAQQVEQVAMESTGVYTPPTMLPKRCASGSMP